MNTIVLEFAARRLSLRAECFHLTQSIGRPHSGSVDFYADSALIGCVLPGLPLSVCFPNGVSIKAMVIALKSQRCESGQTLYTLVFASAWYELNQTTRRRAWTSVPLKKLFLDCNLQQTLHWQIASDKLRDYWQYDETDAAFLSRIASEVGCFLFTDFRDDSLWVLDDVSAFKQGSLKGYRSTQEARSLVDQCYTQYESHDQLMDLCRLKQGLMFESGARFSKDAGWCFQAKVAEMHKNTCATFKRSGFFRARIESVNEDNTVIVSLCDFETGSRLSAGCIQWAFQADWECAYQAQVGDNVLVLLTQEGQKSTAHVLAGVDFPSVYHADLLSGETLFSLQGDDHAITFKSPGVSCGANHIRLNSERLETSAQNTIVIKAPKLAISAKCFELSVGSASCLLSSQRCVFQATQYALGKFAGQASAAILVGDWHHCPVVEGDTPHVGGAVLQGCAHVTFNGRALARQMDPLYCQGEQDAIASGAPTVLINGKACASENSMTVHGGKLKPSQTSLYWLC
ncbi:MAG: hypothetical protein COV52_04805 [Gammaproteobacteria bacterium CG11_big_fil_rev_8_21_14_0_20_46_22]|nr:MAG: hypothetical protein COW05_02890 [Gammaproteobacteria bacterium CG12_big_fil_rev_8_21_14_0_65_46_12]PIR11261.1 MAG: hypothetical protein COV52_04805 [Gammaproteobacteria bacterium CG11_big_fil_rev_8_21_14_0_20_46_22]